MLSLSKERVCGNTPETSYALVGRGLPYLTSKVRLIRFTRYFGLGFSPTGALTYGGARGVVG